MFRFRKPIVPLLIINSAINQEKAHNLLLKLQKIDYSRAKAIGMVVEIDNHMPVQIDKISHFLQTVRQEHKIKIYGFCHTTVTPESYYLLSAADHIYTMPSTLFQLQRGITHYSTDQLLARLGIVKTSVKSDQNLSGVNLDSFTSVNTSKYLNQKFTEINERLYQEAINNRLSRNSNLQLSNSAPDVMLGTEAVKGGWVDLEGGYFEVLKSRYPECELQHVRLKEKVSTRTLQALVASPIIIVLFFIKVLIKYTVIMYLWLKHTAEK